MAKATTIVLEWTYSPKNFFEEKIELKSDQYELVFNDGKITTTMDARVYDKDPSIRERLTEQLEDRFLGAQLVNRKPYELSRSVLYRIHPDGRKDIAISVDSLVIVSSVGSPDIIVKDAEGNIISDSKQERLHKRKQFIDLAARFRRVDPTTDRILLSFDTSVRDPKNELIHLYEIRDALSKRFGGEKKARSELGVSKTQWDRLGILANIEPIKQGRHRGGHIGTLRDATLDELNQAREIAVQMMHKYLEYLERNSQ